MKKNKREPELQKAPLIADVQLGCARVRSAVDGFEAGFMRGRGLVELAWKVSEST